MLESIIGVRIESAIAAGVRKVEEFEGLRVSEKIALLKGYLPDVLVNNKQLYTVLSKGVHELSEQECLKYFPVLSSLMFFVLEEELENRKKQEHLDNAVAGLKEIDRDLRG